MGMPKLALSICPGCNEEVLYCPKTLRLRQLKILRCDGCGGHFFPAKKTEKRGRSDDQNRSRAQEKRIAGKVGGRRQPASGAKRNAKGDFRGERVRGECKFTRARSFSLKLDELLKLREEARGEEALFHIEFQGVYPAQRFVVLSETDYLALKK